MRSRDILFRTWKHGNRIWSGKSHPWKTQCIRYSFSSQASQPSEMITEHNKHCNTCTCGYIREEVDEKPAFACGNSQHENEYASLPPPLPEPSYSVHKRVLPSSLTALSSPKGRQYLLDTFMENTA